MKIFKELVEFVTNVSQDPRIPEKDKVILAAMLALLISPFDIVPDWIPLFGQLDDLVILALILDYFFEVLDSDLLLSHYPWGMKSFLRLKRTARLISWMTPNLVRQKLWSYTKDPYRK